MNKKGSTLLGVLLILCILVGIVFGAMFLGNMNRSITVNTPGGASGTSENPPAGLTIKTVDKYDDPITDSVTWALFLKPQTNYLEAYNNGDYACAGTDTPDSDGTIDIATWAELEGYFDTYGVSPYNTLYIWTKRDSTYKESLVSFKIKFKPYEQDYNQIIPIKRLELGTISEIVAENTTKDGNTFTTTCEIHSTVQGKVLMVITGTADSYDYFMIGNNQKTWTVDAGDNYYWVFSSLQGDMELTFVNTEDAGTLDLEVKFYRPDDYGRCTPQNHGSLIHTLDLEYSE